MVNKMDEIQTDIKSDFRGALTEELNKRAVGGDAYVQMNEMMAKMDKMMSILRDKDAPLLSSPKEEVPAVEDNADGFAIREEVEEDIIIPMVGESTLDKLKQEQANKQLKERKFTVGWYRGQMNPLPANWRYPKGMTLINLINLWLFGIHSQNVPTLFMLIP